MKRINELNAKSIKIKGVKYLAIREDFAEDLRWEIEELKNDYLPANGSCITDFCKILDKFRMI